MVLHAFQNPPGIRPVVGEKYSDIQPGFQIVRSAVVQDARGLCEHLFGRDQHMPLIVLPVDEGIPESTPAAVGVPDVEARIGDHGGIGRGFVPGKKILGIGHADALVETGVAAGVGDGPAVVGLVAEDVRRPDRSTVPGILPDCQDRSLDVPMLQVGTGGMPDRVGPGGVRSGFQDGMVKDVVHRVRSDNTEIPHLTPGMLEVFLLEIEPNQALGLLGVEQGRQNGQEDNGQDSATDWVKVS